MSDAKQKWAGWPFPPPPRDMTAFEQELRETERFYAEKLQFKAPPANTLQILYTLGGTTYAKTRTVLPHDVPVLDYVALLMMKELLEDIRLGEEEARG